MLYQGRLARAGVADDRNKLPFLDGQVYIADGRSLKGAACTVGVGQIFYFDGHSSFITSSAISSTVRMPWGRGMPASRS